MRNQLRGDLLFKKERRAQRRFPQNFSEKRKGEKERYIRLNAEFRRIARRDKKDFLSDQFKEIDENNRMGKTRDLFASLVAQRLSVCLQCGRSGFDPWVRKIPWRRKWQPTPVFLPGESHGWRSLVGYSPWVAKSQTQLSNFTSLKGTFLAKMGSIKDRNGMDLAEAEDIKKR